MTRIIAQSRTVGVFQYELPATRFTERTASVVTLHVLTNEPSNKPSLSNRFFLAHALAKTVLNTHVSGWVHEHIWSYGIAVFCTNSARGDSKTNRLIPYLVGWGLARPSDSSSEEHDYFALGVVLIEIGLWTNTGIIFEKEYTMMREESNPPPPEPLETIWATALRVQVETQMGEAYAQATEWCLTVENLIKKWDFDTRTDLIIEFKNKVAEVLRRGTKM